jgi:KDO2-lipid IV(A) lauroyltransferase
MKLVSRLVQKTEARALVTYAERLPGAKGFRLVIEEVDERLYDPDTDVSVAGLNATVENVVRRIPAQYQWEYKRFKKRPPGEPNPYKPLKPVERQS